jgi:hypothetical protein
MLIPVKTSSVADVAPNVFAIFLLHRRLGRRIGIDYALDFD